jgi:hypothetical protein
MRIGEVSAVLEADVHVVLSGKQRGDVPLGRVVEPEAMPADVNLLVQAGLRDADDRPEPSCQVDDLVAWSARRSRRPLGSLSSIVVMPAANHAPHAIDTPTLPSFVQVEQMRTTSVDRFARLGRT